MPLGGSSWAPWRGPRTTEPLLTVPSSSSIYCPFHKTSSPLKAQSSQRAPYPLAEFGETFSARAQPPKFAHPSLFQNIPSLPFTYKGNAETTGDGIAPHGKPGLELDCIRRCHFPGSQTHCPFLSLYPSPPEIILGGKNELCLCLHWRWRWCPRLFWPYCSA